MKQHEPDHILKAYITNCYCFLCSHTVVFVHMFHEIDITITEIKWYTILSLFIVYSLANTELVLAQRKRDQYHVTSIEQPLVSLCYLTLYMFGQFNFHHVRVLHLYIMILQYCHTLLNKFYLM